MSNEAAGILIIHRILTRGRYKLRHTSFFFVFLGGGRVGPIYRFADIFGQYRYRVFEKRTLDDTGGGLGQKQEPAINC